MTGYFDRLDREVREASSEDGHLFLEHLRGLEYELIPQINLITGDLEFPDDLRQAIQGIIAVWRVSPLEGDLNAGMEPNPYLEPSERAVNWAVRSRSSQLSSELHTLFHKLAGRRLETRFGLLSDSPSDILRRRADVDGDPSLYREPSWLRAEV